MANLETMFAIEFGELLQTYYQTNQDKLDTLISSLGLRSKQQLAQIFAGYDIPSTASIFELLRTLNDDVLTHSFLNMRTTLVYKNTNYQDTPLSIKEVPLENIADRTKTTEGILEAEKLEADQIKPDTLKYWDLEDEVDNRSEDDSISEFDFNMLLNIDNM